MSNILTKADIQNYAPELDLSKYNDATISGMISAATERAADLANVSGFDFTSVVNETDKAYISNDGDLVISVRRRPIVSVSSIGFVKGGFSTSLTLSDSAGLPYYQIPYPNNKLVFPNSSFNMTGTYLAPGSMLYSLRGANVMYKISYYGGYQNPPDNLKYAIALLFRDAFTDQFNVQGLSSFTQGSYSESYGGSNAASGLSPLEKKALKILQSGGFARMEF